MTIEGWQPEPILTLELWPAKFPSVGARMVERVELPGQPGSPRSLIWTFSSGDARPISVTHRQVSTPFPDERKRAAFALLLAARAGWPLPPNEPPTRE